MTTNSQSNPGINLERALRAVPDEYLVCRSLQHRWDLAADLHVVESGPQGEIIERHLHCARCETIRRDRYLLRSDRWNVQRLQFLGRSYGYPDDYMIPAMAHADQAREILRFEQMSRAMGGRGAVTRATKAARKSA